MIEQVASWIPASLLAALVLGMGGFIWRGFAKRLDKIDDALTILPKLATKEELGNMGNRFDERHSNVRERLAVLEATSK